MDSLVQDLRYAVRNLRSRPGFAVVAILTLAVGIGLNTSVFTTVDSALLRSLPYAEPERLVHLWQVQDNQERRRFPFAWQTLRELQASPGVFASVAGYASIPTAWTGRPEAEELPALVVSSNFFDVLGVQPALGRSSSPTRSGRRGSAPIWTSSGRPSASPASRTPWSASWPRASPSRPGATRGW